MVGRGFIMHDVSQCGIFATSLSLSPSGSAEPYGNAESDDGIAEDINFRVPFPVLHSFLPQRLLLKSIKV